MKTFFRNIHLYLSLVAGIIIIISCVTGAIMVFEDEIDHSIHPGRYEVTLGNKRLPVNTLSEIVRKKVPESTLALVKVYANPLSTVEFGLLMPEKKDPQNKPGKEKDEKNKVDFDAKKTGEKPKNAKGGKPSLTAYVNPYTGQVIDIINKRKTFFFQAEMFHRWLLGGQGSIGKAVIGISTLFFFFIILTGIVLWWPKTKKIMRQQLKIKWNGSPKRLNHDLHIVSGFYTSVFLIVIVMSGLIMAFNWVNKGLFTLTSSSPENPEPPASVYLSNQKPLGADVILGKAQRVITNAEFYVVQMPKDSVDVYSVNALKPGAMESATDTYYFDQYSGTQNGQLLFARKNLGQRIRAWVKPIHTGSAFGIANKIFNFIICLVTLTFPVTGVIMWLNRIKKSGKKSMARTAIIPFKKTQAI